MQRFHSMVSWINERQNNCLTCESSLNLFSLSTASTVLHRTCYLSFHMSWHRVTSYGKLISGSSTTTLAPCHSIPLLEIYFPYSHYIFPFKSSFFSDILQIEPDIIYWLTTTLKKINQVVLMPCSVIVSDHNAKLAGDFQNLANNVRWPIVISTAFSRDSNDKELV